MGAKKPYVIGFDLGGTKMLCALVGRDLTLIACERRSTAAHKTPDLIVEDMRGLVAALFAASGVEAGAVEGIGVAVPGPVDHAEGVVLQTPNMPLDGFPLAARLRDALGLPVTLENDVNAGIYGEFVAGAAKGLRNVVGIFPGTGIGGGIILDGKLYRGSTGVAGEVGHMILQVQGPRCGCGKHGCLEALASRTAMAKDAAALAGAGAAPETFRRAGTDLAKYKSKVFQRALEIGEASIVEVVDRAAWFLGIGMANCVNMLDPDAVVLGGGIVEKLGDYYVRRAEASMREHAMRDLAGKVRVLRAELGDDAVPLGAAGLLLSSGT